MPSGFISWTNGFSDSGIISSILKQLDSPKDGKKQARHHDDRQESKAQAQISHYVISHADLLSCNDDFGATIKAQI